MGSAGRHKWLAGAVAALALMAGAVGCTDDDAASGGGSKATTSTSAAPGEPSRPGSGSTDDVAWRKVLAPVNCKCSDGSEFHYWVHEGDPGKVLFFLNGGGACFSAETCAKESATYTTNLEGDKGPEAGGIFDLKNDANPLADYSMVVVPYCTGDLHLGDAVHDYGKGVVVHHNGATNAATALAAAAALYPDAKQVVVAGSSAGSAGAPILGGAAHDVFPAADIAVIADASAAYPGTPEITTAIGSLWGIANAIPSWPETADEPVEKWSLPGTFVMSSRHDPKLRFATYNAAYDEVQSAFSGMIGRDPKQLEAYIDENNASIKAQGVDIRNWVAPGTDHTVLGSNDLYGEKIDGTKLIDWLTDFIAGKPTPDVHCKDCKSEDDGS